MRSWLEKIEWQHQSETNTWKNTAFKQASTIQQYHSSLNEFGGSLNRFGKYSY